MPDALDFELTLIDTPGAYPGIGAEERGQGEAIARNLATMVELRVPIIAVVTGEGGSGTVRDALAALSGKPRDVLVAERYDNFRRIDAFEEESRLATTPRCSPSPVTGRVGEQREPGWGSELRVT